MLMLFNFFGSTYGPVEWYRKRSMKMKVHFSQNDMIILRKLREAKIKIRLGNYDIASKFLRYGWVSSELKCRFLLNCNTRPFLESRLLLSIRQSRRILVL